MVPKPKLSLSINTQPIISATAKPKLMLNTAAASPSSPSPFASSPFSSSPSATACYSPLTPLPSSPTAINTSMNRRISPHQLHQHHPLCFQAPTYTYDYANTSTVKSILKKGAVSSSKAGKRLQINCQPTAVHPITPIDDVDYWFKPVRQWEGRELTL